MRLFLLLHMHGLTPGFELISDCICIDSAVGTEFFDIQPLYYFRYI